MTKKKNPLNGLYWDIEEVKDEKGNLMNTVLYTRKGEFSVVFKMINPVQQNCTDIDQYYKFCDVMSNLISTLGEGYAIQKQDIFCKQLFSYKYDPDKTEFLSRAYFDYFNGRPYTEITTYLIITQELKKGKFFTFDSKKWKDFHTKVQKVDDILTDKEIWHEKLGKKELKEYIHRYMAFNFKKGPFSMNNFKCSDEHLSVGDKTVKCFSVVDIDEIDLPQMMQPYHDKTVNGFQISTDLFSFLTQVPYSDLVVYNQVIIIPPQRAESRRLMGKAKRHASMPDPSNKIAQKDIETVLDVIAQESKMLVYTNFNIIVGCDPRKETPVTSFIESKLYDCGIIPSKNAYNQLELFQTSFPGCAYDLNESYDRFLCLHDTAICMMFKEHIKQSETTPLKVFYTDRNGVPLAIDITGKEGSVKLTDNSNFFCLGPSGTGKSFHMNSVVRQLLEQGTDVVMVDTGDSYEGICGYFGGTYITYSKEKPISMNPFKITEVEYKENFGEKKNFLKSLIFLIFKGQNMPSSIEEEIIDRVIVEYYDQYFKPFKGFSDEDKKKLVDKLLLEDKMNGKYEEYEDKMHEKYGDPDDDQEQLEAIEAQSRQNDDMEFTKEEIEHHKKVETLIDKLHAVANDPAATEGEKAAANRQIMLRTPELMEKRYMIRIEKRIKAMEEQKKRIRISELNFNSFYEFTLERIPQLLKEKHIEGTFNIHEYSMLLEKFYKGGQLQTTLNADMETSLFDERFIVFEIDKIKEDKLLSPIVTLIIMDVFLQKMRLKKGRKALIIEEAWKAISTPTMAEYIKYLYKTVRKFKGIAGVVTQELNDVISSPIVKEAIINNSDIKILLDQGKFKDRYDEIAAILGLTDVDRKKIFTINRMDNKEGRSDFKEVYIARGLESNVYGVEEPPECYMAYTTERDEKEALKIYKRYYNDDTQTAITHFVADMKARIGKPKYLEFSRMVNAQGTVMSNWPKAS